MTNKLRNVILALMVAGAASAAVAQTSGLIGERYGAIDLGYVDAKGADLSSIGFELNVPSSIKGLDLSFHGGYANYDLDLSGLDAKAWNVSAKATGYMELDKGIKGFVAGAIGYEDLDMDYYGYSYTGRKNSFFYDVSVGAEIPCCSKASIRVALGHYDYTEWDEGAGLYASLGANYWINETVGLRGSYTRDFDDDSNGFSLGVVFKY